MKNLTADQVTSFHNLYKFLRKLKVIGTIRMETVKYPFAKEDIRYALVFKGYDPSMKGKLTPHEALDEYFRHSQEAGLHEEYTDSELQGLCRRRDPDEM